MNQLSNYRLKKALVLVFITTQWLLVAPAAETDNSASLSVSVVRISGNARHSADALKNIKPVRVGAQFGAGSVLQTDSTENSMVDLEVRGSDAGGRGTVRMFSNSVLKLILLNSKKSGSAEARDIGLEVAAGQIRISLDGVSDYSFTLIYGGSSTRVTVPRSAAAARAEQTVFVFNGSLTVLKGAVTASTGTGTEKMVHAGEQLRSGASEVTKTPPDAPQLKLGP